MQGFPYDVRSDDGRKKVICYYAQKQQATGNFGPSGEFAIFVSENDRVVSTQYIDD